MAEILQTVFIPHLLVGLGVFALMAYATYSYMISPARLPEVLKNTLAFCILGSYGLAAFCYSLFAACLYALRLACATWEDFIETLLEQVQEKVISHLDGMQDSLAKDQAKVLVRGSVKEVFTAASRGALPFPKWVAVVALGALMLAMRAVLTARVLKLAGATVKVSKIFAGKASLAGAVFLNLRLFATLLLMLVYLVGAVVVVLNMTLVFKW